MDEPNHSPPAGLVATVGIELDEPGEERATSRMPVTTTVLQPHDLVHGGALAALAETVASHATSEVVGKGDEIAVGQSNLTSFLRPVSGGTVSAEATRLHRGRTSWLWDVRMTDGDGRLCAVSRVTLAVRPRPED